MKNIVKNSLKILGIYLGYLILTVIVFYVTGMYVWNMPPTMLVLTRMLIFPMLLTVGTTLFIWIIKKFKE